MSWWAEESVREAVDVLARSGRNDLASDLRRILGAVDFKELDILRHPEADALADAILDSDSIATLSDVLRRLTQVMQVSHCTIHVISEASPRDFTTKVVTTYSKSWIMRYIERRYAYIDPVMQACKTSDQGFYWEHDSSPSPVVRSFWSDARAFGVGPSGYSFPIMTERGDRLAISVCDVAERDVFMERFSGWIGDLSSLGILLADAFCRLASTNRPSSFNPTDDQLSVLRAIAMGATEEELRERDYLYGSYATVERSICALFQTSTVAQAAVLAGRVGLLDDAPLTKADVMSAQDPAVEWAAVTTQSLRKLVRLRAADPTAAA